MATEGNGGLGSSQEEVREWQLMGPTLESVANGRMEDIMQSLLPLLEPQIREPVRAAFEHLMNSGLAMVGGREQIRQLDRGKLQLRFQSSLPLSFFTGKKVEGRGGALIRVNLIDTSTGHVVASGPLSSLKLDVVVLEGDFENKDDDWTQEIFESQVVKQRTGKPPLLTGDLQVSLKEGEGSLGELKFTDNSSWMRSGEFRLGVKVASGLCEGIRVREGKTDAFKVKDRRGECYKKHDLPTLDDDVWRLKNIAKNGAFHKKLNKVGIFKVRHFLWKLGTDDQELKKILGSNMSDRMWETLVGHAKNCNRSGKYYVYYADNTKNSGVVFEMIYELCGLIEREKYYLAENLSDRQKVLADNLKKEACAKWKDIVEYDGLPLLEMNPSKRARFSQTDEVTFAPESCPSDLAFSSYVGPPVNPGQDTGAPVPCQPPPVPSGEASKSSMPDSEGADLIVAMLDDDLGLSSLFWDPLAQADENRVFSDEELDAICREVGSFQDPREEADGRTEVQGDVSQLIKAYRAYYPREDAGGESSVKKKDEKKGEKKGFYSYSDFGFWPSGRQRTEDAGGESSVEEKDFSSYSDFGFRLSGRRRQRLSGRQRLRLSGRQRLRLAAFQRLYGRQRLSGRQRPVHKVFGGGKLADVFLWISAAAAVIGGATAIWVLFKLREYHRTFVCDCLIVIISLAILFLTVQRHHVHQQQPFEQGQEQWAVFDGRVLSKIPRGTISNRA